MTLFRIILLPVSILYGLLMLIRNKLFDWNLLRSHKFNILVISVGNLCIGGTGKTPQVEYLIRLLKDNCSVATLSRGYGRKTKGFILGNENSGESEIGDEPLQYKLKFPDIPVAVDSNRPRGIRKLLELYPGLQIVILDDAFQHRYIKPGLSILLTDYHQLYIEDYIIPSGTLREFRSGAKRADIIIVTKCPKIFSPILRRGLAEEINPRFHQQIYYSYISYETAVPLNFANINPKPRTKYGHVLLLAGIANPYPLQEYLMDRCDELTLIEFPDHHRYDLNDLKKITYVFNNLLAKDKVIITTEKDAMRLEKPEFRPFIEGMPFYYIPIRVEFHRSDDQKFDQVVQAYVKKYNIGSKLPQE
jgi:tetraacyldisaccharide 4'-kinase